MTSAEVELTWEELWVPGEDLDAAVEGHTSKTFTLFGKVLIDDTPCTKEEYKVYGLNDAIILARTTESVPAADYHRAMRRYAALTEQPDEKTRVEMHITFGKEVDAARNLDLRQKLRIAVQFHHVLLLFVKEPPNYNMEAMKLRYAELLKRNQEAEDKAKVAAVAAAEEESDDDNSSTKDEDEEESTKEIKNSSWDI